MKGASEVEKGGSWAKVVVAAVNLFFLLVPGMQRIQKHAKHAAGHAGTRNEELAKREREKKKKDGAPISAISTLPFLRHALSQWILARTHPRFFAASAPMTIVVGLPTLFFYALRTV